MLFGSLTRRALMRAVVPLVGIAVAVVPITATPASAATVAKSTTISCGAWNSWTYFGMNSYASAQACIRWNGGNYMYATGSEDIMRGAHCYYAYSNCTVLSDFTPDVASYSAQQVDLVDATTGVHAGLHACAPATATDFNNQEYGTVVPMEINMVGPEYGYTVLNCQVMAGTRGHYYYAMNRWRVTVNGSDYWGPYAQSLAMGPF